MNIRFLLITILSIASLLPVVTNAQSQTPVEINGQLQVIGKQLCNQYGKPIQLRGMSTHGIQWYPWGDCLTEASLDTLAYGWGADILRISMYVQEGGYETNPTAFTNQVKTLVNEATERGMYALVDFHQLSPGDPNANTENAKTFFTEIATTFKDNNNIIYDIANEPNGVVWDTIHKYAVEVIPVIQNIDTDAVVLCGTHGYATFGLSGDGNLQDVLDNPLPFNNVMYTFHFYANSHQDYYYNGLDKASDELPVFVTEFGTQDYDGDGDNNFTMTQKYLDLLADKKISWCNWNYSDDFRSGAVWKTGTCGNGPWSTENLKESGLWIREKMLEPADDFPVDEVTATENETVADFLIYPNPADENQSVILQGIEGKVDMSIYNQTGQLVFSKKAVSADQALSINSLASGIYSVILIGKDGKMLSQKLVVE